MKSCPCMKSAGGRLCSALWFSAQMILASGVLPNAAFGNGMVTADGVLREDGTILAVCVESGEATLTLTESNISALTGNAVTNFVKEGAGTLVVPADVDLSGYVGDITVAGGIYRIKDAKGVGSTTTGSIYVLNGGAFESAPLPDIKMNIGDKRVVFSGVGPDGNGALRSMPEVEDSSVHQDTGLVFGTNLVMVGNALISSLSAKYTYIGTASGFSLDMNGHELEIRPHSGEGGRGNQQFIIRNPHISNPGRIKQTQALFQFNGAKSELGGGAANVFSITNGVTYGYPSFQLSKVKPGIPWTLEWNTPGSFTAASTTSGATTNENAWTGPIVLKQDLHAVMAYGSDGYAQLTLGGKVSGDYGITVVRNAKDGNYPDSHINLVSPENDFTGPVTGTNITIHLWNSGALPEDGDGIIGTNVTVKLEGDDAFTLPGATLGGNSAIEGTSWNWTKGVVKTGDGRLVCSGAGGGSCLDVQEGTVAWNFNQDIFLSKFAGVVSGAKFYQSYDEALEAYGSDEIVTNVVELAPSFAYDTGHAYWNTANALITCRGNIWNGRSTNETWSFVTAMGRKAKLIVNDVTVCENEFWDNANSRMTCGYGDAVIKPGANYFELRVCTSAKSQGPSCLSGYQDTLKPIWIKSRFGFVVDVLGRNAVGNSVNGEYKKDAYSKYSELKDAGDGLFATWDVPRTDASYIHPVSGEPIKLVPSFDKMVFAAGTSLDCAGFASYSAANVEGFPAVANCGTFAIVNEWILPVSRIGAETLAAGGRLDFSGTTLCVDKDSARSIASDTSFVVATATGGISGVPVLSAATAEDWRAELSADGMSLKIVKKSPGFFVIVR